MRTIAISPAYSTMLSFRSFRNTDPPAIVDLWRSRANQPGLVQPVSADLFEQLVFAKLYFDYQGLILAWENGRALGFAHAGFGPDADEAHLTRQLGTTCVLVVRPEAESGEVAAGLLDRCEQYLLEKGAEVLYGGCIRPLNPFYLGLYGGSELPGILESDRVGQETFRASGYREIDRTTIFQRDLARFQAPMDRQQLQLRRQLTTQMKMDCPPQTWWEACTVGDFDLTRVDAIPRGGGESLGHATFRYMEPAGTSAFVRQAGLVELEIDPLRRRQGVATYLLSDAFTTFARQGIMRVEVQTMAQNTPALGLYKKLGFEPVEQGTVFRKEAK